jgi:hypothetical protein
MSEHSIFCAANGCPAHGTMSTSTTGNGQFYCFLHFGCKPGTGHAITDELQRLGWLVKLTQTLRAKADTKEWDAIEVAAGKEIRLNQSSHLLRGQQESLNKWLYRLEDTLRAACAVAIEPQHPLEV